MDIRRALLGKSLRELPIMTACLNPNNKQKPEIFKGKRSEWV